MAVYHLKVSVGSRAGGQSAVAKADYIEREGRYEQDREELEHSESDHMPEWAKDAPHSYWEAADEHERANGRLYREVQFALPKELNEGQRRELASGFAKRLTEGERLPYTLAVHRGDGENPHAHLMISERGNDGIERGGEQWFKRYNAKAPEKGGARKSRAAMPQAWLEDTRKAWEQTANQALERAGREERIDGRSLAERRDEAYRSGDLVRAAELSREPNVHLGPSRHREGSGAAVQEKLQKAGRVERGNAANADEREADSREVARIEGEIRRAEARLKETYDRVRRAIDQRIQQAGRAIRAGAEAAARAGRAVGRAAGLRSQAAYRVEQNLGGAGNTLGGASAEIGRTARGRTEAVRRVERAHVGAAGKLERTCREIDLGIQRAGEAIGREVKKIKFTRERGLPERGLAKQWRERSRGWDR